MSAKLQIPYYSFHAGFLIDPDPKELGKKISIQKNDENIAEEIFRESKLLENWEKGRRANTSRK